MAAFGREGRHEQVFLLAEIVPSVDDWVHDEHLLDRHRSLLVQRFPDHRAQMDLVLLLYGNPTEAMAMVVDVRHWIQAIDGADGHVLHRLQPRQCCRCSLTNSDVAVVQMAHDDAVGHLNQCLPIDALGCLPQSEETLPALASHVVDLLVKRQSVIDLEAKRFHHRCWLHFISADMDVESREVVDVRRNDHELALLAVHLQTVGFEPIADPVEVELQDGAKLVDGLGAEVQRRVIGVLYEFAMQRHRRHLVHVHGEQQRAQNGALRHAVLHRQELRCRAVYLDGLLPV